ncbi:MAG: hypothetical protein AAB513_00735 [Patescibacteria group bacterium]
MGKGSQKQNNELRKKATARIHSLINAEALEYVANLKNDFLPEKLTNIPNQKEDSEIKRFLLCFTKLSDSECKLGSFNHGKTKALLNKLKMISNCEVRNKISIIRDKIYNNPPYSSLFKELTPEVELYEMEFADSGRIFFFHVQEKLNIISIEDNHRNI